MSLFTMGKKLTGEIKKTPLSLVNIKLNDALGKIYDEWDWSFQTQTGGWLVPGIQANSGTFTVTPFQNTVIADATATAALAAISSVLVTTLAYRDPSYAPYRIIGYDTETNAPYATLTLDRSWMEPTDGAGQPYMIYQAYFPVPVADFRRFIEIRDTTNARTINFWKYSQKDLSERDPQRTDFADPRYAVPYQVDQVPGSATYGQMLYELWPHQLSRVPYSFTYNRRGPLLASASDTVPYPITEEAVEWRAKELLYAFKEAQRDEKEARGTGPNWQFLIQLAEAEYKSVIHDLHSIDLNLHNNAITRVQRECESSEPFANRLGQLNIGR